MDKGFDQRQASSTAFYGDAKGGLTGTKSESAKLKATGPLLSGLGGGRTYGLIGFKGNPGSGSVLFSNFSVLCARENLSPLTPDFRER